jgi:non-specific serine/threonine protein kinase
MVVYEEDAHGQGRYRLLETVRHYAHDHLHDRGEMERSNTRHCDWFATLPAHLEKQHHGTPPAAFLEALENEIDNFRAVLERCEAHDPETGLRLVCDLGGFWMRRGHVSEGRRWLDPLLEASASASNGSEGLQSTQLRGEGLRLLSTLAAEQGDYELACRAAEEVLQIADRVGSPLLRAEALYALGDVRERARQYDSARRHYQEARDLYRGLGQATSVAAMTGCLGNVAYGSGDYPAARAYYEEMLSLSRQTGYRALEGWAFGNLANVLIREEQAEAARSFVALAVGINREYGDHRALTYNLDTLASLAVLGGDAVRAARLLGAAEALRSTARLELIPYGEDDYHRNVRIAKEALGEVAFQHEWSAGRQMTLDEAVDYGLRENLPVPGR